MGTLCALAGCGPSACAMVPSVKTIPYLILLLLITIISTGCGGDAPANSGLPAAPRSVMVDGKYSDKRFIDMMVPHHQMAIDMAKEALQKSQDKDVRALSERIVRGQGNEIEELKRVREDLYGSRATPLAMHPDAMANMGMRSHSPGNDPSSGGHEHHEGMDMSLSAAEADEFDKQYIEDMIAHHAAAIPEASLVLIHSKSKPLKNIAREIINEQSREIGMMSGWRAERWPHRF